MQSIDLSLTVARPVPEAQAQILEHVEPLLRSGYTSRRAGDTVEYRPKFVGLPLVWVIRRLQGDRVTFTFEPRGSATEVRVAGRLHNRRHAELTGVLASD